MVYTIGGIKGGSGKTTVATNLTILLASKGRDVLLVDADDQETATDFNNWRQETLGDTGYTFVQLYEKAVATEVNKMASKYDDIVIDTGGRDTKSQRAAIGVSDIYLVPFVPRSFDIWTLEKVEELINEISVVNTELKSYAFINKADHQGTDNQDVADLLNESKIIQYVEAQLGNRKAFSHAATSGLSVLEYKPKDPKAIDELNTLFKAITGRIKTMV